MFDPFLATGLMANARLQNEVLDDVAKLKRAQADVEVLAGEVQRLFLVTEAMWRILKDEHGYDDDTLRKKMESIEAAGGRGTAEGAKSAPPCKSCGRPLARRLPRCIYCGTEHAVSPFEA